MNCNSLALMRKFVEYGQDNWQKFFSLKKYSLAFILFCGVTLSGCASMVATVNVLQAPDLNLKNQSFSMLPMKKQKGNLEYEYLAQKVVACLEKYGMYNTSVKLAKYIVMINYGTGKGVKELGSVPIIGQTGISSSYTTGTYNGSGYGDYNVNPYNIYGNTSYTGNYTQRTYYTPQYGVVGENYYTYFEYPHYFSMNIYEKSKIIRKNNKPDYSIAVVGANKDFDTLRTIPYLINAAFQEFPWENGTVKTVRVYY